MSNIDRTSPAKINLFLEIKGKRSDGYHEVVSWMHAISLSDSISIDRSDLDICTLRSNDTSIPFGKRNLCIKAYEALKLETGLDRTVVISLEKNIPLGSGMGGGSSNAGSVIMGVNDLFDMGLDDERMMSLAANVGTDVPFFIKGGSALATGRGIEISPLPAFPQPLWMVIAKPETAVSTGDAYKWVKGYSGDKDIDRNELEEKITGGDFQYVFDIIHNSFEPVIFEKHPAIKEVKERLLAEGCAAAQMTGSGAAVFGLCENEKTARGVAETLAGWEKLNFVQACKTI